MTPSPSLLMLGLCWLWVEGRMRGQGEASLREFRQHQCSGHSTHICLLSRSDLFIFALMLSIIQLCFLHINLLSVPCLSFSRMGAVSLLLPLYSRHRIPSLSLSLSFFLSQLLIQQIFTDILTAHNAPTVVLGGWEGARGQLFCGV